MSLYVTWINLNRLFPPGLVFEYPQWNAGSDQLVNVFVIFGAEL